MKVSVRISALTAMTLASFFPASAFAGDGSELPTVADCRIAPLNPGQLTADEKAIYDTLPSKGPEATKYLYTRGFLRYAKLVAAGSLDPTKLPELPARANWYRGYLTADEARDILDVALGKNMIALMNGKAPTCR